MSDGRRADGAYWGWTTLGTIGSATLVIGSGASAALPVPASAWWWHGNVGLTYRESHVAFYVGFGLLALAWWRLRPVLAPHSATRQLVTGALWALPLSVGAPLGSRDLYSYVAVGRLVSRGFNPYLISPSAALHGVALNSVASVWQSTTTPYGPLFVWLDHGAVALAGEGEVSAVLAARGLSIVGLALLVAASAVVARHRGIRRDWTWWILSSPAVLLAFISSGHNDVLMLALTMVGIAALDRQYWALTGLAFGAACAIKLPALVVVFLLGAVLLRRRQWGAVLQVGGGVVSAITASTVLAGEGWGWASPTALRIPTRFTTEITPLDDVAHLLARVALWLHLGSHFNLVHHLLTLGGLLLLVGLTAALARRVANDTLLARSGVVLVAAATLSPTTWPWYFLWGVALLAVTPVVTARWLAAVVACSALLVGPGGTMMIGGNGYLVAGPLLVAGLVWAVRRRVDRVVMELRDA